MSNVASLELCKELYELSGWENTQLNHWVNIKSGESVSPGRAILGYGKREDSDIEAYPAYDAGYLLRKLPHEINGNYIMVGGQFQGKYSAGYYIPVTDAFTYEAIADTPEDALCKLAIELFKAGILPISGRD